MRLKFLLVISAAYLVLISGILYSGLQREKGREEFWIQENSALQLHTINDNVGLEIEKLKAEAVKVATAMEAGQKEDAIKAMGQFVGVAAVSAESESFIWQVDSAKPDIWNGPWFQRAKEIPETENQPRFFAVQTHDENLGSVIRSAVFFMAKIKDKTTATKKTVRLVGVLAQPLFQSVLASQQNAGMQFFIFSQKGLAIAHTISDYVGNSLAGDKLYEEIRKNKLALGSFSHKDFKGDAVVSMFEKIEHTDLTVVAQLRPAQLSAIDWGYYGQAYMIIFGVFCLLSGAMFFVIPREIGKTKQVVVEKLVEKIVEKPVEKVVERFIEKPAAAAMIFEKVPWVRSESKTQSEFAAVPPTSATSIIPSATPGTAAISTTTIPGATSISTVPTAPSIPTHIYEKMVRSIELEQVGVTTPKPAFEPTMSISTSTSALPTKMSILAKVISQVKAPLLSILGHVQIAKAHPQGGSLQAIENETRSAREVLDRLAQYSGLSQSPTITVPLIDLIDSALRSLEGPILRGAIKINKEVAEDLCVKCDPDDFKMALTAIFRNSIEAMERVLKKELTIEAVKKNNSFFELRIADTGEGILPRNMAYLFEPFYSTKSPLDHKGLGLAAVQGIMRTHLGEISITSDLDRGTLVKISLPVSTEASKRLAELQMINRPAWMELIKTPSKQEIVESENLLEPIEIQKTPAPILTTPSEPVAYTIDESDVAYELESFDFSTNNFAEQAFSPRAETSLGSSVPASSSTSVASQVSPTISTISSTIPSTVPSSISSPISSSAPISSSTTTKAEAGPKSEVLTKTPLEAAAQEQQIVETSLLFASPVKRLKKKSEPLDKLKVQIPRPEEKL